jgi:flavin-binding protein dodecin
MPDKTYTIVDVVGVSEDNILQAIRNALTKAGPTLRA